MKNFKQFMSESVNISGDFNGTLIIGNDSTEPTEQPTHQKMSEDFVADVVWEGKLYRMELSAEDIPTRESLGEQIQNQYPGAVVHNIYPAQYNNNSTLRITGIKRYQPEKLTWTD
jgi:hypothetical protein